MFVFDYSKHKSFPVDNISKPQHRCLGHSAEGYGLCWNAHIEGRLLSGSDDATVCLWDVKEAGIMNPVSVKFPLDNTTRDKIMPLMFNPCSHLSHPRSGSTCTPKIQWTLECG